MQTTLEPHPNTHSSTLKAVHISKQPKPKLLTDIINMYINIVFNFYVPMHIQAINDQNFMFYSQISKVKINSIYFYPSVKTNYNSKFKLHHISKQ